MAIRPMLWLFIRDHWWVVALWAASVAFPLGAYSLLVGPPGGIGYYLFLGVVALLVGLGIRLASTWDVYREKVRLVSPTMADDQAFDWHRIQGASRDAQWTRTLAEAITIEANTGLHKREALHEEHQSLVLAWAHHAKTPVAIINLALQTVPQSPGTDRIQRANGEIERSLDALLQAIRIDDPANDLRIDQVSPNDLAKAAINRHRDLFIAHDILPALTSQTDQLVYTDEKWALVILEQLLTNAIKFSPANASVEVIVAANTAATTPSVTITIADCGIGIPPEDAARVFQPFFTGTNGRRGQASTGIGLFLAQKTAQAIGADLALSPRPGGGTLATLTLPSHH